MSPSPQVLPLASPTAPGSPINISFRSGMSAKSDLLGAMAAGIPVGVVAGLLTTAQTCLAIPRYLDEGGVAFIDSGAFNAYVSKVTMDWDDILRRYELIASLTQHPERLLVVAPDVVGDQAASLELLRTWSPRLRPLLASGCQLIVPLQRGSLSAQDVLDEAASILGTRSFVAGIPSNRAALSIEDCRSLRHRAFHILGQVQMTPEQVARIDALRSANPDAFISADANWLRSRIRLVQEQTTAERARRRHHDRIPSLDHPRVAAVARALLNDVAWGQAA